MAITKVIKKTSHSILTFVNIHGETKELERFYPEVLPEDVVLDDESAKHLLSFIDGSGDTSAENYTLLNVLSVMKDMAFVSKIKTEHFDSATLTSDTITNSDKIIPTSKAIYKMKENLLGINDNSANKENIIYAPTTAGTGIPYFDNTSKTWKWVPTTGKKSVFANTLKLNNRVISDDNDISLYAPSLSGTLGQILTSTTNGEPKWYNVSSVIGLNGAMSPSGAQIYAPTTPGSTGAILVSQGPGEEPKWQIEEERLFRINGKVITSNAYEQFLVGSEVYDCNVKFVNPNMSLSVYNYLDVLSDSSAANGIFQISSSDASVSTFDALVTAATTFANNNSDAYLPSQLNLFYVYQTDTLFVIARYESSGGTVVNGRTYKWIAVPYRNEEYNGYVYITPQSLYPRGIDIPSTAEDCVDWSISSTQGSFLTLMNNTSDTNPQPAFYSISGTNGDFIFGVTKSKYDKFINTGVGYAKCTMTYQFAMYYGEEYNGTVYTNDVVSFYAPTTYGEVDNILVSRGEGAPPEWRALKFNSDGTVAVDMDTTPTAGSSKGITSGGVYNAIWNDLGLQINSVSKSMKDLKNYNFFAPTTLGTNKQSLVSDGSSMVWKNHGSYFTSGVISSGSSYKTFSVTVPKILSDDNICVSASLNSCGSSATSYFSADNMDYYSDACAYVYSVSAVAGSATVSVTVKLKHTIPCSYPVSVEVTFS